LVVVGEGVVVEMGAAGVDWELDFLVRSVVHRPMISAARHSMAIAIEYYMRLSAC
jgi:hypothetical protein